MALLNLLRMILRTALGIDIHTEEVQPNRVPMERMPVNMGPLTHAPKTLEYKINIENCVQK